MELVKLTHENIEKEHICCAISNNKDIQVMSKKNWMKDRLDEGLVILLRGQRGIYCNRRRIRIQKKHASGMPCNGGFHYGGHGDALPEELFY